MSFQKEAQSVGILFLRILSDIAEEVTAVGVGGNGVLSPTNAGLVVKKHVNKGSHHLKNIARIAKLPYGQRKAY